MRTLVATSRRAYVCNIGRLTTSALANSVLLGVSGRAVNRFIINDTNNIGMATAVNCGTIRASTSSMTIGITIGNLHNNRSNLRVYRGHNGTGGVLTHFLGLTVDSCRTHLTS